MSDFSIAAGVTHQDVLETRKLDQAQKAGEFILRNERPLFRKLQEHDFKLISSNMAAAASVEYDQVFAKLGIEPEVSDQLQTHLSKIQRASLEAEASILQVTDARAKYEAKLRSILPDEAYAEYRRHELAKPARAELEHIREFASRQNAFLRPEAESELVEILLSSSAVYGGLSTGPFGELPQMPANTSEAEEQVARELQHLVESSAEVSRQMNESSLGESERRIVEEYLSHKIQRKSARKYDLRHPPSPSRAGVILGR